MLVARVVARSLQNHIARSHQVVECWPSGGDWRSAGTRSSPHIARSHQGGGVLAEWWVAGPLCQSLQCRSVAEVSKIISVCPEGRPNAT